VYNIKLPRLCLLHFTQGTPSFSPLPHPFLLTTIPPPPLPLFPMLGRCPPCVFFPKGSCTPVALHLGVFSESWNGFLALGRGSTSLYSETSASSPQSYPHPDPLLPPLYQFFSWITPFEQTFEYDESWVPPFIPSTPMVFSQFPPLIL